MKAYAVLGEPRADWMTEPWVYAHERGRRGKGGGQGSGEGKLIHQDEGFTLCPARRGKPLENFQQSQGGLLSSW